jgi:hypothetical protein
MSLLSYIETVDLRAAHWLNANLTAEMVQLYSDPDEIGNYVQIKRVLQSFIKGHGSLKVHYKRSPYDKQGIFRLYSSGIQTMPTKFRGLLCKNMTDVDLQNCHPMITWNLCQRHNISCPYLTEYCENRASLIERGIVTKHDVIRSLNKGKRIKATGWLSQLDAEIKVIQEKLAKHYVEIAALSREKSKKNPMGTFSAYLAHYFENKILEAAVSLCPYKVSVLMFDGFMFEGVGPSEYLTELAAMVKDRFDMKMVFTYKPIETPLVIPEEYTFEDQGQQYEILKTKYEAQGLAFIEKLCSYTIRIDGNVQIFASDEMRRYFNRDMIQGKHFFDLWVHDPTSQTYVDVGVWPHDVKVPPGKLNLWTGFAASRIPVVDDMSLLDPVFKHIKIMANHEDSVYEFLLTWLANMFQYPSSPSVFCALSSLEEGTGKNAFVKLIKDMVGPDKCMEINNPAEQLFGKFNGDLRDIVFFNLNEIGRCDMNQFYDRLKAVINSETCEVHDKGAKAYQIANIRHYMSTSNNPHAIICKEGNRRYMMSMTSEELIGNDDYFDFFWPYIERLDVQAAFYRYLMSRDVPRRMTRKDIPITKLMKEAYELNRDPIVEFIEDMPVSIRSDVLYGVYRDFMKENGYKEPPTKRSFEMKFSSLAPKHGIVKRRVEGVEEGQRVSYRVYEKSPLLKGK